MRIKVEMGNVTYFSPFIAVAVLKHPEHYLLNKSQRNCQSSAGLWLKPI